jgi:uncharacterized protein (TIGR02284 family)
LETCRDSEAGFLRAGSRAQKAGLKEFLGTEALQQAVFIAELDLALRRLGVAAEPRTPGAAKLNGWKEITGSRLLPSGEDCLLALCDEGLRAALDQYLKALQDVLPVAVLELIERQGAQLEEAYSRLREMREQLQKNAPRSGRVA